MKSNLFYFKVFEILNFSLFFFRKIEDLFQLLWQRINIGNSGSFIEMFSISTITVKVIHSKHYTYVQGHKSKSQIRVHDSVLKFDWIIPLFGHRKSKNYFLSLLNIWICFTTKKLRIFNNAILLTTLVKWVLINVKKKTLKCVIISIIIQYYYFLKRYLHHDSCKINLIIFQQSKTKWYFLLVKWDAKRIWSYVWNVKTE